MQSNEIFAGPNLKMFTYPRQNYLTIPELSIVVAPAENLYILWIDELFPQQPNYPTPILDSGDVLINETGMYSIILNLCLRSLDGASTMIYTPNIILTTTDNRGRDGVQSSNTCETRGMDEGYSFYSQSMVMWLAAGDKLSTLFTNKTTGSTPLAILPFRGDSTTSFRISRIY